MYIMQNDAVKLVFTGLGFPTWLIYPMAIAKILGVIMVLTKFKKFLTEWAYAGFLFNFLLAFGAHTAIGDGEAMGAVVAFVLWLGSYATWKMGWKEQ